MPKYRCADLPIRSHLPTGFYLRIYLFSQVAYNYIPVSLYPQPINQQNRSIRVTVYAPASPCGSLGCRPNQRFGCPETPHTNQHTQIPTVTTDRDKRINHPLFFDGLTHPAIPIAIGLAMGIAGCVRPYWLRYLYSVVRPIPRRRATSAFGIPSLTHSRACIICSSLRTFARPL